MPTFFQKKLKKYSKLKTVKIDIVYAMFELISLFCATYVFISFNLDNLIIICI